MSLNTLSAQHALSNAQQRMWVLEKFDRCDYLYHVPVILAVDGILDISKLNSALKKLTLNQTELLTQFVETDHGIVKVYNTDANISFQSLNLNSEVQHFFDLKKLPEAENFFTQKFNLIRAPLFRAGISFHSNTTYLFFCFHHMVIDGWSAGLFLQQLSLYYADKDVAAKNNYPSYVAWEKDQIEHHGFDKSFEYWKEKLKACDWHIDLPTDYSRTKKSDGVGNSCVTALTPDLNHDLIRYAKTHAVSVAQLILAAFQVLIGRYSGQQQISIGLPTAGRLQSTWQETIGLFVNTQILLTHLDYSQNFATHLQKTKKDFFKDAAYLDIPYDYLLKMLYQQNLCTQGVSFNVLYNYLQLAPLTFANSTANMIMCLLPTSKFDLSLHVVSDNNQLTLIFEYATGLFHPKTIEQIALHFQNLLAAIISHESDSIATLDFISAGENA